MRLDGDGGLLTERLDGLGQFVDRGFVKLGAHIAHDFDVFERNHERATDVLAGGGLFIDPPCLFLNVVEAEIGSQLGHLSHFLTSFFLFVLGFATLMPAFL